MTQAGRDATAIGIAAVLAGVCAMSLNDMLVKFLSGGFPLHQIVAVRAGIGILVTLALIRAEGGLAVLATRQPLLHALRGALVICANMTFFAGLVAMPLAETTALYFVAPLLMALFAVPLLGERLDLFRFGAIMAGLAGVAIVLRPGGDLFRPVAALPLLSAVFYALMQILTRRIGATEKASAMAFYTQLSFLLFSAVFGFAFGDGHLRFPDNASIDFLFRPWVWPHGKDALLLLLLGINSAAVGYLMSQAYRMTNVAVIAPFEYAAMPLALMWGLVVFGDLPDHVALAGIGLILAAGLATGIRERAARRRFVARSASPP